MRVRIEKLEGYLGLGKNLESSTLLTSINIRQIYQIKSDFITILDVQRVKQVILRYPSLRMVGYIAFPALRYAQQFH